MFFGVSWNGIDRAYRGWRSQFQRWRVRWPPNKQKKKREKSSRLKVIGGDGEKVGNGDEKVGDYGVDFGRCFGRRSSKKVQG